MSNRARGGGMGDLPGVSLGMSFTMYRYLPVSASHIVPPQTLVMTQISFVVDHYNPL